jgi:hypothetical protein
MTRVLAFLALLLLVAFFLPWLPDVPSAGGATLGNGSTMSGFELTYGVVMMSKDAMTGGASMGDLLPQLWPVWILLGIPVFGLLTLLFGLAGAGFAAATGFLAGLPVVVLVVKGLIDEGSATFDNLEPAAFAALAVSALLVLLAFVPRRRA